MASVTFPGTDPLNAILRLCAGTAPNPWYPKLYCQETGVARDSLDVPLERLRLGGMIHLTEWVEGAGQGYALGRRLRVQPTQCTRGVLDGRRKPIEPAPGRYAKERA